jgi:hypothetical protein
VHFLFACSRRKKAWLTLMVGVLAAGNWFLDENRRRTADLRFFRRHTRNKFYQPQLRKGKVLSGL